ASRYSTRRSSPFLPLLPTRLLQSCDPFFQVGRQAELVGQSQDRRGGPDFRSGLPAGKVSPECFGALDAVGPELVDRVGQCPALRLPVGGLKARLGQPAPQRALIDLQGRPRLRPTAR